MNTSTAKQTAKPAVKRTNKTATPEEQVVLIEALRKLALQRDTLKKYALVAESAEESEDGEDEVEYNGKSSAELDEDIVFIKGILAKFGDTRPLVLKSERKAKPAKGKAKAKKPAKASVKA
jgi:hypothetical protein